MSGYVNTGTFRGFPGNWWVSFSPTKMLPGQHQEPMAMDKGQPSSGNSGWASSSAPHSTLTEQLVQSLKVPLMGCPATCWLPSSPRVSSGHLQDGRGHLLSPTAPRSLCGPQLPRPGPARNASDVFFLSSQCCSSEPQPKMHSHESAEAPDSSHPGTGGRGQGRVHSISSRGWLCI